MPMTTIGIKIDKVTQERIEKITKKLNRSPQWLMKQAISNYIMQAEGELALNAPSLLEIVTPLKQHQRNEIYQPFIEFSHQIQSQTILQSAITAAYRTPERELIPSLLKQSQISPQLQQSVHELALKIAERLRQQQGNVSKAGLVQGLLQEFSLSSQEGIALMCLAEALLRIPDKNTRDQLIRDKISAGNWRAHLGHSPSIFINAVTWGLLFTGKLVKSTHNEKQLSNALNRLLGKGSEPLLRKAVDTAMRLMGEQFVTGETIAAALKHAQPHEAKGFRYSYDMLGEAALTESDAQRYLISYQEAIHAIGKASDNRGIYEGPGISIKLSALHPRYNRAHYERVMSELYPRLLSLALLARQYNIGLNIDAEEADRLEISLSLLEKLCFETQLSGWDGIGFVVQAYQKRCPTVISYLIDLAKRSKHRLMIRLVKGAYWDSEIKRAQVEGLEGYPVYTRKVYTDIAYLACAHQLLAEPQAIYPQFATHNAHSLAYIYHIAGENYFPGQFEFQCLHGMGETLYEQVVGTIADGKLNRPCRIYAPVGTHETLLAYLVRRLLENGANTSFVNRIADHSLSLEELIEDPVNIVEQWAEQEGAIGLPHPKIPHPYELYGSQRPNAKGFDLSNEQHLAELSHHLLLTAETNWIAEPIFQGEKKHAPMIEVINPAEPLDIVGHVREATTDEVSQALESAVKACSIWQNTPIEQRAIFLQRAALLMEERFPQLLSLLVRESGKTFSNAIAEIREAVDFLRYYSAQAKSDFNHETHLPIGPIACISPWNFPLAIFSGQIAAALVAGNPVLAKPAEQTPLIAAQAIKIFLEAGIPPEVLQFLPGKGESVGAQLTQDQRIKGIMFTGSTDVAALLHRTTSHRHISEYHPFPLIAETGGLNAMIVDSSALTEQVVNDVMISAFDSAGQRCSALRLLCIQEDVAEQTITMLKGAMAQWRMGDPSRLSTDVGPLIDAEAKQKIEQHIQWMREQNKPIYQAALGHPDDTGQWERGHFVQPTLIELKYVHELKHEVFGPVLHVIRYSQQNFSVLIEQINQLGYGLTLGVHTRLDERMNLVTQKAAVGNLYINRNMVGAVVGVQPFGGEGLSGTGPKAGGPLYLYKLLRQYPDDSINSTLQRNDLLTDVEHSLAQGKKSLSALMSWAQKTQNSALQQQCQNFAKHSLANKQYLLSGPTGESNTYRLLSRDPVVCIADDRVDLLIQLAAVLANHGTVIWPHETLYDSLYHELPEQVQQRIMLSKKWDTTATFNAILFHGDKESLIALRQLIATRSGSILHVQGYSKAEANIKLESLLLERSISLNTTAAGGNTSLMTME